MSTEALVVKAGWLYKWVNILKRYQKRWFILSITHLSYYREKEDVQILRGGINLLNLVIHRGHGVNFVVSDGGTQTFHLRSPTENDKERWITAMEFTKSQAIASAELEEFSLAVTQENKDLENFSGILEKSFDNLHTFHKRLRRSSSVMQMTLSELEGLKNASDLYPKLQTILKQAFGVKEDLKGTLEDCEDLLKIAEEHKNNMEKLKQMIVRRIKHLGKIVDQLARENSNITSALQQMSLDISSVLETSDEEQFYDALEISPNECFSHFKRSIFRTPPDIENLPQRYVRKSSGGFYEDTQICEVTADTHPRKSTFSVEDLNVTGLKKILHRTSLPSCPLYTFSIWSFVKSYIGKDISRISIPVYFNEPLSTLQRLTEEYEYASLLHKAAACQDSCKQLLYVSVFVVSSYSSTRNRSRKPSNPLLGETYECDRFDELGWRCVSEQVSHHPPIQAQHCEGHGWTLWQEFSMTVAVKGTYVSVIPSGICHLEFPQSGNHYTWTKIKSTVHNIVVGTMWVDHHGELHVQNHTTGDNCTIQFSQHKYFKSGSFRKIAGVVKDKQSNAQWVLQGRWDEEIGALKVSNVGEEQIPKIIWKQVESYEKKNPYNMSVFACQLNEPEEGVAPTDSRMRPDLRLMEEGKFEEANSIKAELEEKQRQRRLLQEQEAKQASERGEVYPNYSPAWFTLNLDPITNNPVHIYTGDYWKCKAVQDWKRCRNIYL